MLRDDDEFDDPGYTCPVCRRSFHAFSSLDDHMVQHRSQRRCHNCGKQLGDSEYHKC
jgi:DNA-directed RNA polymerase subunit N (RpoN/RPB10)